MHLFLPGAGSMMDVVPMIRYPQEETMPTALARVKTALQERGVDPAILTELESEYAELHQKADRLETLLIMIVRTGWPWDEEGEPNAIHHAARGGFTAAMLEAQDLLGLNLSSRITRTEPRT